MTRRQFFLCSVFWLACIWIPRVAAADSVVHIFATAGVFVQAPGSYQGGPNGFAGGDQTFSSANGWNFVPSSNRSGGVSFQFYQYDANQFQSLDFAGPGAGFDNPGVPLAIGDYSNGTVYPANQQVGPNQGKPAVDFNGEGYSITEFQVLDIAYDPTTGLVTRFAANFVQRGYADSSVAIYGQIRFNSDVPLTTGKTYVQFAQSTYAVSEADGGVSITVFRSGATDGAVSVTYATTTAGSAKANKEYTPVGGTLTWAAGDTSPRTFILPILENTRIEGNTTVDLQLTGDSVGLPDHTLVTIADDDPLPPSILHYQTFGSGSYGGDPEDVTVSTAMNYEFDAILPSATSGTGVFVDTNAITPIPVGGSAFYTLSFPTPGNRLTVGNYTSSGAYGGVDFSALTTELKSVSDNWQILQVTYGGDGTLLRLAANFEALDANGQPVLRGEVRFHSTVALRGTVTLDADAFRGDKSSEGVVVTVNRAGDTAGSASVNYRTTDYSAVAKIDYTAVSGTLSWAAGDASPKTFTVPVLHASSSGNRVLFVNLSGDTVGAIATGSLTIVDDSLPPASELPAPDGQVDTNYPLYLSNSAEVNLNVLSPQADGDVYAGGNFIQVNTQTQPGIVRLDAQGNPDPTFQSPLAAGAVPSVNTIAVEPDGKVLVAGTFETADGLIVNAVRLNTNGSRDGTFRLDTRIAGSVYNMALQPDGRVVMAGNFPYGNGLARLNANGSLDTSFTPPVIDHLVAYELVLLQPDGRLIVADDYGKLTRLNPDGSVDSSFRPSRNVAFGVSANAVLLQPDGKLVAPTGTEANQITRYNHDGTIDTSFNFGGTLTGGSYGVRSIALQPDGKLLVGFPYQPAGAAAPVGIVRLNANGSLDTSFSLAAGLPSVIGAMALEADGSLLLSAGYLSTLTDGVVHTVLARLAGVSPTAASAVVTIGVDIAEAIKSNQQVGRVVLTRTGDLSGPLMVAYTVEGKAVAGTDYATLTGHKSIKAGQTTAVIKVKPLSTALGRGPINVKIVLLPTNDYTVGTSSMAKVKIVDYPDQ